MRLHTSPRAPNPRRVDMFLAEKGIDGLERRTYDLNRGDLRTAEFRALNPLGRVPVLELDDGRCLAESRAICSYLESLHPEPNLMGRDAVERAFVESADRQVELFLLFSIANAVRHTHPGLAPLEQPQFADFGSSQGGKLLEYAAVFDRILATRPWLAGDRFTIADITGFCGIEFAKLIKFRPAEAGFTHLANWRERVAARPSAKLT
jgi:glutathione S-transferase